jgi:hypothetical protein
VRNNGIGTVDETPYTTILERKHLFLPSRSYNSIFVGVNPYDPEPSSFTG